MEDNIIDTVKESEGRYRIVLNPQFNMEVDEGEYYAVRRKPQYPKTYKECCEVLMGKTNFQDFELVLTKYSTTTREENSISPAPPHITLINNFYKLLICRDAYWKLSGEQMGLGKPWKPDSKNKVYYIFYCVSNDTIKLGEGNLYSNAVFAFPTKEMGYAFFENFKELFEGCKELLT